MARMALVYSAMASPYLFSEKYLFPISLGEGKEHMWLGGGRAHGTDIHAHPGQYLAQNNSLAHGVTFIAYLSHILAYLALPIMLVCCGYSNCLPYIYSHKLHLKTHLTCVLSTGLFDVLRQPTETCMMTLAKETS